MNKTVNSRMLCGKAIEEIGTQYKDLVHITADGNDYTHKNRSRHFDVSIAEQNQVGLATGFAIKGFRVIINGISSFILYNAFMQIRNEICYPKLNITIIGIGTGLSYGHLGFTHHSLEDIAVMNTLPNLKIYLPSDGYEAVQAIKDSVENGGCSYIRTRNGNEPVINEDIRQISFDKPQIIKKGTDAVILTYGALVYQCMLASEMLKLRNKTVSVININAINVYSLEVILKHIKGFKFVFIAEEHYEETGVGSIIINKLYGKRNSNIIKIGIRKEFCKIGGTEEELFKYYGIDHKSIYGKIISYIS